MNARLNWTNDQPESLGGCFTFSPVPVLAFDGMAGTMLESVPINADIRSAGEQQTRLINCRSMQRTPVAGETICDYVCGPGSQHVGLGSTQLSVCPSCMSAKSNKSINRREVCRKRVIRLCLKHGIQADLNIPHRITRPLQVEMPAALTLFL